MKQSWVGIFLVFCLSSCVTKGKYEDVLRSIKSKEKQQAKLDVQKQDLLKTNQLLRDSADRLGGDYE